MKILAWAALLAAAVAKKRVFVHSGQQAQSEPQGAFPTLEYGPDLAQTHLVVDLPSLPPSYNHRMFAGDIGVDEPELRNKGSIFYWFLESQGSPTTDPLVIWLNGGPGCSSMEGLLIEHGPFLAKAEPFQLELNPYSWNRNANMLYVDQPVGTGFARVFEDNFASSQREINVMFLAFLRRWGRMFPEFQDRPLFLAGESYAGRYIPHFATEMLAQGGFNLRGVLIGNGWTHPMIQAESLPEYSWIHGVVSAEEKAEMDVVARECRALWEKDHFAPETWQTCEKLQNVPPALSGNNKIGRLNIYDVRLYDPSGGRDWPWRATGEHSYLNRPDVRRALHVTSTLTWEECSNDVELYLTHEDMFPTHEELQALIPRTRVLLYNGQFDWICNHVGVERFIDTLSFNGRELFGMRHYWIIRNTREEEQSRRRREVDDEEGEDQRSEDEEDEKHRRREGFGIEEQQVGTRLAGYARSGGNLTYVLVLGGSHMVPMDKRPETLDLFERFLRGQSFAAILPATTVRTFVQVKPDAPVSPALVGFLMVGILCVLGGFIRNKRSEYVSL